MSLHRNTLQNSFHRPVTSSGNAVLRAHCASLRSATISIGRAHLSLVSVPVSMYTVSLYNGRLRHIRNAALQKHTTCYRRRGWIASRAMTKTAIGRLINFLAKCSPTGKSSGRKCIWVFVAIWDFDHICDSCESSGIHEKKRHVYAPVKSIRHYW